MHALSAFSDYIKSCLFLLAVFFYIRQESQAHKSRIINFMLEKHFSLNDSVNINC